MSPMEEINVKLFAEFIELITTVTGIIVKESDRIKLKQQILKRSQLLRFNSLAEYYQLLVKDNQTSSSEWQEIIVLLTNNESYFFRDKLQLNTLSNKVLPEIIKRKTIDKTIRICSAGCSTGEEPYTLAMIIKELIPDLNQWNILILAIDIDNEALNKAKKGIYSRWSFRGVESSIQQKYFQRINNQFHLCKTIKDMVEFQNVNLVNDVFPQPHLKLQNIDIFICRNVFIYFPDNAIATVLDKIYDTLEPNGYLLTGHTELAGQNINRFKLHVFDESIIYQRQTLSLPPQQFLQKSQDFTIEIPTTSPIKPVIHNAITVENKQLKQKTITLKEVENLYIEQEYELAIDHLHKIIEEQSYQVDACYLLAQIYADLGKHDSAIDYCQKALEINSEASSIHYLLAQIAEEKGNFEEAKAILKKIVYLDPLFIAAYLSLSQLYQQEGDLKRGIKMQVAALNILEKLPENSKILQWGNISVKQLTKQIKNSH